jgi:uncharacterized SAM-dependent methyltransferase
VDVANELRDALARRHKELPARWLATVDAALLRTGAPLPTHEHERIERQLGQTMLEHHLASSRPRGIVCLNPSASDAALTLAEALCQRGSVTSIVAVELIPALAAEMRERILSRAIAASSSGVASDCTVDLPLPDTFPRPRVYLCLGNVLGSTTTVGAVRMLRILRTTMNPGDSVIVGVDAWRDPDALSTASPAELDADAARHLGALEVVNATLGATFDVSRFDYRPAYDAENNRLETHLVARRGCEIRIPGVAEVRLKKGESIRTSVSCTFERHRLSAMMAGVGLTLREWTTDPASRFAVALATTAS